MIQQLNARKGRLIVMCSKGDGPSICSGCSCRLIEVPLVADCLQPVINIIPLQVIDLLLKHVSSFNSVIYAFNDVDKLCFVFSEYFFNVH